MSDSHQDSEGETPYRGTILDKKKKDKNEHPAKFKNGNKLWLTREPGQGSIQVVVQEKQATSDPKTGGWEYKVKDPDTELSLPGWYVQSLLKR